MCSRFRSENPFISGNSWERSLARFSITFPHHPVSSCFSMLAGFYSLGSLTSPRFSGHKKSGIASPPRRFRGLVTKPNHKRVRGERAEWIRTGLSVHSAQARGSNEKVDERPTKIGLRRRGFETHLGWSPKDIFEPSLSCIYSKTT